jgi:phage/plasmid-associated DNA primase
LTADRLDPGIVSLKYLDAPFQECHATCPDWRSIPTPAVDVIFRSQCYEEDTLEWALAMMGRLLYEVGELDNWQVGMFVKGIAGSGKSTLAAAVKSVFPDKFVGTLSGSRSHEKKFGLSAIYDKMIYLCTEVKSDFQLDQADWQSMISGEDVSVAIKFETARSVTWKVPGMLCGNQLPGWVDASGSVVRRILMFEFMHKVVSADPKLPEELKRDIGAFVCKINRAYLEKVARHGQGDIWKPGVLSRQILQWHEQLRRDVDPLAAYFESGAVVFEEGAYMREKDLKALYLGYRRDNSIQGEFTWDSDHYGSNFAERDLKRTEKELREWPVGSGNSQVAVYVLGIRAKGGEEMEED